MLRHTGAVCTGLGLLWFGPSFAQEIRSDGPDAAAAGDPLTAAWFDTVQSIGVLESLSRQLDVRRPGAIDNLRRNTEAPIADDLERQARLDGLEREIARLRSELALIGAEPPTPEPAPATTTDRPRAPRVETRTTGLSDAARDAMLEEALRARPRSTEPFGAATPPLAAGTTPTSNPTATPGPSGLADPWTGSAPTIDGGAPPRAEAGVDPFRAGPDAVARPGVPADPSAGDPARGLPIEVERRLAELEAELARLEGLGGGAAQAPPAALPGAGGPAGAGADPFDDAELETTLVLGPLEPAGTGSGLPVTGGNAWNPAPAPGPGAEAPPFGAAPGGRRAAVPTDAGTLPLEDRVARAAAEAERQAAEARARAEREQHVPGYSADPVGQGRAAYLAGDHERAVTLLARFPDRADALYWQARALEKLERVPEALKLYERVASDESAGPLAARATTDLEFLRWKWEHNEAFQTLRASLEAKRKP